MQHFFSHRVGISSGHSWQVQNLRGLLLEDAGVRVGAGVGAVGSSTVTGLVWRMACHLRIMVPGLCGVASADEASVDDWPLLLLT